MNVFGPESERVVAKTCGFKSNGKQKVTYSIGQESFNFCMDKKDILLSELKACEKLLFYTTNESERVVVNKEILDLKNALDLLT